MTSNQPNTDYKTYLTEEELPTHYYNVRADMAAHGIDHPATHEPVTIQDLEGIFATELAKQELNATDRFIPIPKEVRDFYKMYRPSPLVHAEFLERELDTPAKIYYKFEGSNTSGSHKLNSAIPQAYYAKEQGLTNLTTDPEQVNGAPPLLWQVDFLGSTSTYTWLNALPSKNRIVKLSWKFTELAFPTPLQMKPQPDAPYLLSTPTTQDRSVRQFPKQ